MHGVEPHVHHRWYSRVPPGPSEHPPGEMTHDLGIRTGRRVRRRIAVAEHAEAEARRLERRGVDGHGSAGVISTRTAPPSTVVPGTAPTRATVPVTSATSV